MTTFLVPAGLEVERTIMIRMLSFVVMVVFDIICAPWGLGLKTTWTTFSVPAGLVRKECCPLLSWLSLIKYAPLGAWIKDNLDNLDNFFSLSKLEVKMPIIRMLPSLSS